MNIGYPLLPLSSSVIAHGMFNEDLLLLAEERDRICYLSLDSSSYPCYSLLPDSSMIRRDPFPFYGPKQLLPSLPPLSPCIFRLDDAKEEK